MAKRSFDEILADVRGTSVPGTSAASGTSFDDILSSSREKRKSISDKNRKALLGLTDYESPYEERRKELKRKRISESRQPEDDRTGYPGLQGTVKSVAQLSGEYANSRTEGDGLSLEQWAADSGTYLKNMQDLWGGGWVDSKKRNEALMEAQFLLEQAGQYRYKYITNEEALAQIDALEAYLKNAGEVARQNGEYFSQWDSEEAYIRSSGDNREARQQRYAENQKRIAELKAQWDSYEYDWTDSSQRKAANQMHKDIQAQIDALEAENRRYERGEDGYTSKTLDDYYNITQNADFVDDSAKRELGNPTREALWDYDVSVQEGSLALSGGGYYDENGNIRDSKGNIVTAAQAPQIEDKLGVFLAGGDEGIAEASALLSAGNGNYTNTWANLMREGDVNGWKHLSDQEIGIYYYLYENNGRDAAYKFLSDMTTELTRRETLATQAYIEQAPLLEQILLNVASIPLSVVGGGMAFVDDTAKIIQGEDINPYSRMHAFQNTASAIREDTAKDINDMTGNAALPYIGTTFGDAYQAVMSMGDMAFGSLLGGGGQVYGTLMGMGAASSTAKDLYQKGASTEQMAVGGLLAGAAEMFFEKYSIEHFINLKNPKSAWDVVKNFLTQGGIEATEEMGTQIANTITDAIVMASRSDWQGYVNKYLAQGDSQALATVKALFMDVAPEVLNAGIGGFISGAGGGLVGSAVQHGLYKEQTKQQGQRIIEAGGVDALKALAMEMAGAENGSGEIARLAEKVNSDDTGSGNAGRVGRLYDLVSESLDTKVDTRMRGTETAAKETAPVEKRQAAHSEQRLKELEVEATRAVNPFDHEAMAKKIAAQQELAKLRAETPAASVSGENASTGDIVMDAAMQVAQERAEAEAAEQEKIAQDSKQIVAEAYADLGSVTSNPVIVNMPQASRESLISGYDPASGVSAQEYVGGANMAYWYGYEGITLDEKTLPKNSVVRYISKAQRESAYALGAKDRAATDAVSAESGRAVYQAAKEKLGDQAGAKRKGRVVFEDGLTESAVRNRKKRAGVTLAKKVAEVTGIDIHVYSGAREYGFYKNGMVWLNINATMSGQDMMTFTVGHELCHAAREISPEKFKKFADYLLEKYGEMGKSVEELIRDKIQTCAESDYFINEHEAYEEVICDACQRMLLDTNALETMYEFRQAEPEFWEKIVNEIRKFIENIRKLFANADPGDMETELFKQMDEASRQMLANLYADMIMDTGDKIATIRAAFGDDVVFQTNENGEFTVARGEDANGTTKLMFNIATWENGGRDTLVEALRNEGYSAEDIKAAVAIMDGKQELVKRLGKQFPEQGRINKATLHTDIKDGHSVMSALVSNGDYPVNIDLLMVCKKRKAYQRVINRLCETGLIQQATLDALAIAEINKILGKYGFETACLGCFVESRRLRIQEWADTIVSEWNGEVKKRNPNAKAFGFGKGKASLTPDEVMTLVGELEGHEKNDKGNLNLGKGNSVQRMGRLMDKVPSLRKTLSVEDLITPDGLAALRRFDSNLFSMVKSRYGSNSPKFVQDFNPYNHELAMYGTVPSKYKSLREYLYAIGGARMQSFSDFIVENWFDYCQIVADLAARKLPMHTYTKEIALVKLFGLTGIKINMSLIPDIDRSLGKDFAGLTRDENGKLVLIWSDKDRFKATGGKSYMQSINFADAVALQNDPRYSGNIGTIAIGISDKQIEVMLDDSRIRMIIPYHSSGMNPIFADLVGTSFYKDYTDFQNTTVKHLLDSKGNIRKVKLSKEQAAKLTSGFLFNEVLQELGDARAAAQAYLDWCADASQHTITIGGETYTAVLTPKFDAFSGHENYYKLLEDFNTYDCISGQAAPQGDVQQVYPEGFEDIIEAELKAQEGHRQKQAANQAFDKAMAEIEAYLGEHTKADTVFYAEQHGIKLSAKDKKLGAEDKKKLAGLRKGAKMSVPKAGYVDRSENGGYDFTKSFAEQLKDYKRGMFPQDDTFLLGRTPDVLTQIGLAQLPLTMDRTHVGYALDGTYKGSEERVKDHILSEDDLAKIPDLIAQPVAIIQDKQLWQKKATAYSVDVIIDMEINGKRTLVPVNVNSRGYINSEEIDSNRVQTVHGNDDTVQRLIAALNEDSDDNICVFYINKEKASEFLRPTGHPISSTAEKLDGFIHRVTDKGSHVKMRISSVIESQQFIRWFGDWKKRPGNASKVVHKDGTPRIVYHYTDAEFWSFDTERSGSNQGQTHGDGIYLSTSPDEFSYAGKNRMELYACIRNPFEMQLTDEQATYVLEKYAATKHDLDKYHGLYRNHAMEKLTSPTRVFDYLAEYAADNGIKVSDILKDLGYDGVHDGSEWVAFDATQVKSATNNIGTFDGGNTDIRYKTPNSRGMSSRQLLADAFEELIQSPKERELMDQYRANITKVEDVQERLKKLRGMIRELTNAKGDKARIAKMNQTAADLSALIDEYDRKLLELEASKPLRDVLARAKTAAYREARRISDENMTAYRKQVEERFHRGVEERRERAAVRKYRERIAGDVKELTGWILRPDSKNAVKRVPEVIRTAVVEFMESIDFTSKRQLDGKDPTQADRKYMKKLRALRDALKPSEPGALYSGYFDLPPDFMENLQKHIDRISELVGSGDGQYVINRMNSTELEALSSMVKSLKKFIKEMNLFHANAMYQHVYEAAEDSIGYMSGLKDAGKWTGSTSNFLMWQQMRPALAFERFGKGGVAVYDGLRRGMAQLAFNAKQIVDFSESVFSRKQVEDWEKDVKTIKLKNGETVSIPVSHIMSFYALSKRPQALQHLLGNGIRVATFKGKGGKTADNGHLLTMEDVGVIIAELTQEQKQVADSLQAFMADVGGKWGNAVSMRRFGEEIFGEKNYFPINSDGRHLQAVAEENPSGADLYALLNMSFTRELTEHANNRVMLYSVFDVFANHMASMAQYNALALPVLDAIKWLNYQQTEEVTDSSGKTKRVVHDSVREEMARAFGVPEEKQPGRGKRGYAESFVVNILKDFNGTQAHTPATDTTGTKLMQTYNRAQVAYNARVIVQQPTAILRAAMVLKYADIIRGIRVKPSQIKANMEEMLRYSGVALWKDMGFFDVNISRGLTDMIKQDTSAVDRFNEFGMKGAEWADKLTWAGIWSACKEQVRASGKFADGSQAFFEETASVFEDVIYKTQVVDSILTKNEYLRSKGFFAKATSSFMAEPTTSFSLMAYQYDKFQREMAGGKSFQEAWKKHGKGVMRTMYVFSISSLVLAAIQAVADAWRDDDEYQDFLDKFGEAFGGNLLDEAVPFNKLPLVNDVYDLAKELAGIFGADTYGNAPTSVWMQWFNQLVNGTKILVDKVTKKDTDYTWYGGVYKLMQAVSGISGLPLANLTREAVAIWNNTIAHLIPRYRLETYSMKDKSEIKYAFMDGYLDEAEALAALMDTRSVEDEAEGKRTVAHWKFISDNPQYEDISVSALENYQQVCVPKGVDIASFYNAWKFKGKAESDKDADGKVISGSSAKDKVLEYIDELALSREQKDSLYLALGYGKTVIDEAPWN